MEILNNLLLDCLFLSLFFCLFLSLSHTHTHALSITLFSLSFSFFLCDYFFFRLSHTISLFYYLFTSINLSFLSLSHILYVSHCSILCLNIQHQISYKFSQICMFLLSSSRLRPSHLPLITFPLSLA